MLDKPNDPPIAHIHAPRFPHDPVEIIGNGRGLERLINALIDAVDLGGGEGEVSTSAREPFAVRITCLEGKRRPEEWRRSGSPHWDIDDPIIARVLDLTEENARLRHVVTSLRRERKSIRGVDYSGGEGPVQGGNRGSG